MNFIKKTNILLKQIYLDLISFIINTFIPIGKVKAIIYNCLHPDISIKKDVNLRKNIVFYNGSQLKGNLKIDRGSFINEGTFIDFSSNVIIGKNVAIGMRVLILSATHKIGTPIRCGESKYKITKIEDNCWIGAGAIIYPGITVGKGSVVAAGEIVYSNIPENMLLKQGKLIDIINKKEKYDGK
jgi:acetyltransferase-like isoleucine patch superfamily enzyme